MTVYNLGPDNNFFNQSDNSNDQIFGEGGNDTIFGRGGSDSLFGGDGSDDLQEFGFLPGDRGQLFGGAGEDSLGTYLSSDAGADLIDGGTGTDLLRITPSAPALAVRLMLGDDFTIQIDGTDAARVRNVERIWFDGRRGNDDVRGGELSDFLFGGGGNDTLIGGAGDDVIWVEVADRLHIDGGKGVDLLSGFFQSVAGVHDNVLVQIGQAQRLVFGTHESVLAGIDRLQVSTGNGNDTVIGGRLNDHAHAYAGDDSLALGGGNDWVFGGDGDDVINLGSGKDTVSSGSGSDTVYGRRGNDIIDQINDGSVAEDHQDLYGGRGNDTVNGAGQSIDRMFGGKGRDYVVAYGNDAAYGGAGDDALSCWGVSATLSGGRGEDRVAVRVFADGGVNADGGGGDDLLVLSTDPGVPLQAGYSGGTYTVTVDGALALRADRFDVIQASGSSAGDMLAGGGGDDTLDGKAGDDALNGGGGADRLAGGKGDDRVKGGAGNDRLLGGLGTDVLSGGGGADVFAVETAVAGAAEANLDRIQDFVQGTDVIDLSLLNARVGTPSKNEAFDFIGSAAFSAAGQVRAEVIGGITVIIGDMGGDRKADFMLVLTGVFTLTEADFLL